MTAALIAAAVFSGICVPVEGERILAADLAKAQPAFHGLPADVPLGWAPAPGAQRIIRVPELRRLARHSGLSFEPVGEICVTRAAEAPAREALLGAMRSSLPGAGIEILDFSRHPAPRGEIEFPAAGLGKAPPSNPQAPVLWRGWVRYGRSRRFPVWARVRVEERKDVAKGQTVRVEARHGAARVLFDGRAEAAGRAGETIPVRNPVSGKRFHATVEGEGRVAVGARLEKEGKR